MTVRQRRYHRTELASRGEETYEKVVRPKLPLAALRGQYVVIDVDSGEFEVDSDELAASDRLLSRLPDAQVWLKRVGYPHVRRFGPRLRRQTA